MQRSCLHFTISEAVDSVVVDHADSLHMCVNDRGADESESPRFEILAQRVGLVGSRRNLPPALPAVQLRASTDEPPAIAIEAPEFLLNREKRLRVAYHGLDLQPIANDCRIQRELLDPSCPIPRYLGRVERAECPAITLPFFQYDRPTETRLGALEHQEFKVLSIIVDRYTPFFVVISNHQRIV